MTSRSIRRRLARRPGCPVRAYRATRNDPGRGLPQVTVSMTDSATRISQSFLIMPGTTVKVNLTGHVKDSWNGAVRVLTVPLEIRADVR